MNKNNLNEILKNFEKHIDKTIYSYLLILMKYIFLEKENFKNQEKIIEIMAKLKTFTEYINSKIIIKEKNFIKIEPSEEIYTVSNFKNIINFVKKQNLMYAGDIIEGILIIIFSYGIKTPKEDYFGKYIYNNLSRLKEISYLDKPDWFANSNEIFKPKEIKEISRFLMKESFSKKLYEKKEKPILHEVLLEIAKNKLNYIRAYEKNSECTRYINNGVLNIIKKELEIFNALKRHKSLDAVENDFIKNSISNLYYYIFKEIETPLNLINSFLISLYIYDQNRNNQFINPIDLTKEEADKEKGSYNEIDSNLVNIPFTYDLRSAGVEGSNSNIIISPISIEPRISKINFLQNNIREIGLFELGKMLSFNKKINSLNLKKSLSRGYYLDYFNSGFGIFENGNLDYLNLSFSYLNDNSVESLPKLFKHFKGIKTLNLTNNEMKDGAKGFFILLKKLYRTGKTHLENLYLNNCDLSDASLYELGELLKSHFCGLKSLSLGGNPKSIVIKFLKKIKLNKSLEELILNKSDLNDNDIDDICKILSNTNIKSLYLYKNDFRNFGFTTRIIFRTRIIKKKEKNIDKSLIKLNKTIMNLDLSNNFFIRIDYGFINLINELIQDNSTLNCLDLCRLFYGIQGDKYKTSNYKYSDNYRTAIDNTVKTLKNRKEYYDNLYQKRQENLLDIERYEKKNVEEKLNNLPNDIIDNIKKEILENENVIYSGYLLHISKYILASIFENEKEEKYKKIIEKENLKKPEQNEKIDEIEENELFINKLMDYIKYERAKKEIAKINGEIEFKKLILI